MFFARPLRIRLVAAIILAACIPISFAAPSAPALSAELPRVEDFFAYPRFFSPKFSPDGKMIAVVTGVPRKRTVLTVIDLATDMVYRTATLPDTNIERFHWVNNKRLAYSAIDSAQATGNHAFGPGLHAINFDGGGHQRLAEHRGAGREGLFDSTMPSWTTMLNDPGAQDSDAIWVTVPESAGKGALGGVDLYRLDTVKGERTKFERPFAVSAWMLDEKGEPRLALTGSGLPDHVQVRDRASGQWRALTVSVRPGVLMPEFMPLGFGPDGTLYVSTALNKDKQALHTLDITSGKISEQAVLTATDYDFEGRLIFGNNKLLGFRLLTDAESTIWLDPAMKALQQEVDQRLTDTVNMITPPRHGQAPWVLVESYSDVRPVTFLLYNTDSKAFKKIGIAHPNLPPEKMGRQRTIRYRARDGLQIESLLTLPPGGLDGRLPLIVLAHDGPFQRGSLWGWNPETQFLASRGYAVLEPSFRGTRGFGATHFQAGWKQLGLKMQNDLADGARWAIAEGIADSERICIAGKGYGGYAVLMGLSNDPDLFRCGISWLGVTDINIFYKRSYGLVIGLDDLANSYALENLVGDRVKDAEQLKATSPLLLAARIKQPLLLAYGQFDSRVPLIHAKAFSEALKPHNPGLEEVVYRGEAHGWNRLDTKFDFWTHVERFLHRHTGKPVKPKD